VGWLRAQFGTRVRVGEAGPDGWVPVEIGFEDGTTPARALAGFVLGLEVLSPAQVRDELAELGRRLVERYGA
jgi:hypothetical protein